MGRSLVTVATAVTAAEFVPEVAIVVSGWVSNGEPIDPVRLRGSLSSLAALCSSVLVGQLWNL